MSVVRARTSRSLAFTMALAVLFALAIPFSGLALAHSGPPSKTAHTLDVEPEVDDNPVGSTHTLTATVSGGITGQDVVRFEFEEGPAVRVNCNPHPTDPQGACTAGTASNDGNTPTSPDASCTTTATDPGSCRIFFTSDTAGRNIIRAWVDDDGDTTTYANDADTTEGRDEAAVPGEVTIADDTDVVQKDWFTAQSAAARLDCDDESGDDDQLNQTGTTERYTCRAYTELGGTASTFDTGIDTAISGVRVDLEISGQNDPDNKAFTDATNVTVDVDNACTTGADGTCPYDFTQLENEVGTSQLCFFTDDDNDAQFSTTSGQQDGSECQNEVFNSGEGDDRTDVVQKTYQGAGTVESIDCEPENDSNVKGTQHVVTCTVRDTFGNTVSGVPVDIDIDGANDGADPNVDQQLTNASGAATLTYTDSTTTVGPEPETDTITGCVDTADADPCDGGAGEAVDEAERNDTTDTVQKFWFTTLPTVGTVIVDMDVTIATPGTCASDDPTTADNDVNTTHELCAVVTDAASQPIPGATVTFTKTGPGEFIVDDGDDVFETGEGRGQTVTANSDSSGRAFAELYSTAGGSITVTATSGSKSDTGTKVYIAGQARTLDCEPETATNPTGTQHVVSCTAKDRFGNPTNQSDDANTAAGDADSVTFTESGVGRIVTGDTGTDFTQAGVQVTLDSNGVAEVVLETAAGEEGTQTLLGAFTSDVETGDDATPLVRDPAEAELEECDRLAGDPSTQSPAAPAGICADEVTKTWSDEVPPPEEVLHSRVVNINTFKHVRLPGKRARSLIVKGTVATPDGYEACHQAISVKLQLRVGGEWITRKTDVTNSNGGWKMLVRDVRAKYRAVATKHQIVDEDNNQLHICQRAEDTRRHRHRH